MLTPEQIDANAKDYLDQFGRIILLDEGRVELRRNSEWLGALGTSGLLELAARSTLARMLERDDFAKRYGANEPISLQELMYPLLQGWDSVNIEADIEIGGTDQTFNLLVGRDLQEQVGQRPQIVMTHELLVGTDGTQKMSQSLGNYVGLTDSADDMYGKTMSIPDAAMPQWFRLASGLDEDEVAATVAALEGGALEPVEGKRRLAHAIASRYHGAPAADAAAERFRAVFGRREVPADAPEHPLPGDPTIHLPALLVDALGLPSRSEARRRIAEGAVRVDGEQVRELDVARSALVGRTLQVGRRFVRLVDA
jgi:tyrosyl-tRNA synthetase